jgi:hypothetical protein
MDYICVIYAEISESTGDKQTQVSKPVSFPFEAYGTYTKNNTTVQNFNFETCKTI